MTQEISGFGTVVNIIASNTFPTGFTVTQFADDADPLDFASTQIANGAMGLNGDALFYSTAVLQPMVLNVIPNSEDDNNLQVLANANRVAQGKTFAQDIITATIIYPDGTTKVLTGGKLTQSPFGIGISSAGRMKTKQYEFLFQSISG